MTGKHPPPVGGRTLADDLRQDLKQCESWVIQVGSGYEDVGLALLRLLDRATDRLERLEQRGVDLRAERGRLESLLRQLHSRDKALVASTGAAMAEGRPPDARWWWYLDEQVAANRRRRLKRTVVGTLVGLSLLIAAFLFYEHFLAPPPHIRQANRHVNKGEQAVMEGDLTQAIELFETATALDPEHNLAYVWLGVLYQTTGETDLTMAAFEHARTFFDIEIDFLLQRGLFYLAVNNETAANKDAVAAIELAPDRPEGHFLLGNVAEHVGDIELALAAFRQAADLAEAAGEVELQAIARVRLANLFTTLMARPQQ